MALAIGRVVVLAAAAAAGVDPLVLANKITALAAAKEDAR